MNSTGAAPLFSITHSVSVGGAISTCRHSSSSFNPSSLCLDHSLSFCQFGSVNWLIWPNGMYCVPVWAPLSLSPSLPPYHGLMVLCLCVGPPLSPPSLPSTLPWPDSIVSLCGSPSLTPFNTSLLPSSPYHSVSIAQSSVSMVW